MILGSCSLVLLSHGAAWPTIVTHDLLSHEARLSHICGQSLVFTSASLPSPWFPGSIVGAGSRPDCERSRPPPSLLVSFCAVLLSPLRSRCFQSSQLGL